MKKNMPTEKGLAARAAKAATETPAHFAIDPRPIALSGSTSVTKTSRDGLRTSRRYGRSVMTCTTHEQRPSR